MTNAIFSKTRNSGWLRSNEVGLLAWPLAMLLAMLLTFSVYLNSALAAGSDDSLCKAIASSTNSSETNSQRKFSSVHCQLCIFSIDDFEAGSNDRPSHTKTLLKTDLISGVEITPIASHAIFINGIRAPPSL